MPEQSWINQYGPHIRIVVRYLVGATAAYFGLSEEPQVLESLSALAIGGAAEVWWNWARRTGRST